MKKLKIFNSLKNKKEEFFPVDPNNIRVYACGPTVYDYAHIGNARMAVVFDTLVRLLRFIYPKVTYVSNITDIDDKIINRSIRENTPFLSITRKFTDIYNRDMRQLNVLKPDHQPLATEYVHKMIIKIQELFNKEFAYFNEGHVLFNVSLFPNYGCLSKSSKEEQIAGSRIQVASYKKNPEDFVLWKPSLGNEPGWESPWGFGRPGWHTECFVMSEDILKTPFDIHGGGLDLKFPHHENEIAQSCCNSNNPELIEGYARYWVHNGFVNINEKKMSKSMGNIKLVKEYLKIYDGEIIRLALLSSHYRSPLKWTENILVQSKSILNKFYNFLHKTEEIDDMKFKNFKIKIDTDLMNSLLDDLNISKSFVCLNKKILIDFKKIKDEEKINIRRNIQFLGKILGIFQKRPTDWFKINEKYSSIDQDGINALIEKRNIARASKDYQLADDIRGKLSNLGIEIKDEADKTIWKRKIK